MTEGGNTRGADKRGENMDLRGPDGKGRGEYLMTKYEETGEENKVNEDLFSDSQAMVCFEQCLINAARPPYKVEEDLISKANARGGYTRGADNRGEDMVLRGPDGKGRGEYLMTKYQEKRKENKVNEDLFSDSQATVCFKQCLINRGCTGKVEGCIRPAVDPLGSNVHNIRQVPRNLPRRFP